jgi:hypothetical protein
MKNEIKEPAERDFYESLPAGFGTCLVEAETDEEWDDLDSCVGTVHAGGAA